MTFTRCSKIKFLNFGIIHILDPHLSLVSTHQVRAASPPPFGCGNRPCQMCPGENKCSKTKRFLRLGRCVRASALELDFREIIGQGRINLRRSRRPNYQNEDKMGVWSKKKSYSLTALTPIRAVLGNSTRASAVSLDNKAQSTPGLRVRVKPLGGVQ